MPIKKTSTGAYEISVCVQGQRLHRRLKPGSSARDAKLVESQLIEALSKRTPLKNDLHMVEVMAIYLENARHLRSPKTAGYHAARIAEWCKLYTAQQARQCAAHIIKDLLGAYKPATINRSLGTLQRGLTLAWERGLLSEDYSCHIKLLPENNSRNVYLTIQEVQHLASFASPNVAAAIWIAIMTGCRRGEIVKIRQEDIRGDHIVIHAGNTKTLKTRIVPIVPALRPWLEYLPLQINAEGLKTGFHRARLKAGMRGVNFHDLRHSCATLMLSLDVPLDVVRDVLGHSSIKTTERYAHALVDRQRSALESLGNLALGGNYTSITPDANTESEE